MDRISECRSCQRTHSIGNLRPYSSQPLGKVLVQLSKPRSDGSRDTSASDDGTIGLTLLAGVGAEVVGASGLPARPLGGGTSIGTDILLAFKTLWPAGRRVLPRLLPSVDGQVEQPLAVIHRLDSATYRPVSLEDLGSLAQVANDASCPPGVQPRGCRASPGPSSKASPSP